MREDQKTYTVLLIIKIYFDMNAFLQQKKKKQKREMTEKVEDEKLCDKKRGRHAFL